MYHDFDLIPRSYIRHLLMLRPKNRNVLQATMLRRLGVRNQIADHLAFKLSKFGCGNMSDSILMT